MFSVVIPVWNKRHTIEVTVAGVLAQTYRDFELIIVDDGSTDDSMERLNAFDDPRIRTIVQPNAGPGAARNRGIEGARHDWVALLDADDIWMPDHLAGLDRIRAQFPTAGLIGTAFICTDRDGKYRSTAAAEERIEHINYFERVGNGEWLICSSSSAIPKSTYAAVGGFGNAPVGQDIEYWARIALERSVVISNRVSAVYRLGTGGISDTMGELWRGRALRHARDLGPSVAMLLERYPNIRSSNVRRAVDRYIDGRFRSCARRSAKAGDFQTLRSLPRLYLRRPPPVDRLIFAIARLPAPAATIIYAAGFWIKALRRLLRRKFPSPGSMGRAFRAP